VLQLRDLIKELLHLEGEVLSLGVRGRDDEDLEVRGDEAPEPGNRSGVDHRLTHASEACDDHPVQVRLLDDLS